jgi:hypothetical protein
MSHTEEPHSAPGKQFGFEGSACFPRRDLLRYADWDVLGWEAATMLLERTPQALRSFPFSDGGFQRTIKQIGE